VQDSIENKANANERAARCGMIWYDEEPVAGRFMEAAARVGVGFGFRIHSDSSIGLGHHYVSVGRHGLQFKLRFSLPRTHPHGPGSDPLRPLRGTAPRPPAAVSFPGRAAAPPAARIRIPAPTIKMQQPAWNLYGEAGVVFSRASVPRAPRSTCSMKCLSE
jgi:hypothetical protein